jgi:aminoglycoside 6'-N-acetyltransferase
VLTLRELGASDLELVRAWLDEPLVARWYLPGSSARTELEELRRCLEGTEPTHLLIVVDEGRPIGWCQWYSCADYPDHAAAVGAEPGDIGIDYAIGDPSRTGRGVGTELIWVLVDHLRDLHPASGVIADPQVANVASCRVLAHNGFELLGVRALATEPTDDLMAIYRLDGASRPPGRRRRPATEG